MEKYTGKTEYTPEFKIKIGIESSEKAVKSEFSSGGLVIFFGY